MNINILPGYLRFFVIFHVLRVLSFLRFTFEGKKL